MISEQHAALLRQQDRDRAGEAWQISERELDEMASHYHAEEGEPFEETTMTLPKLMTPAEVTHELKGIIESEGLGAVLRGLSQALLEREAEARSERCSEYADIMEAVRWQVETGERLWSILLNRAGTR